MSDIPLHSLRRPRKFKSGYTPLNTEQDDGDEASELPPVTAASKMPSLVSRVAAVSASRKHENTDSRWKGKGKQKYADDPEEQVNLLDDERDEYNQGGEEGEDSRAYVPATGSKVC